MPTVRPSPIAPRPQLGGLQGGHATRGAHPTTHERVASVQGPASSALSSVDREALAASVRAAPVIPSDLMREPVVRALADDARRVLARGTGRSPSELEVDARVLPGTEGRVLLFRDARGRSLTVGADRPIGAAESAGLARALADMNVIAGVGLGFRIVPGVFSAGAMETVGRFADRDGLARHARAGLTSPVGSAAYVWELKERPEPVGASVAVSVPFVSSGTDPLLGDRVELSIPGYVTLLAAVKHGEKGARDVGWLGVVWHQGLLGVGPGPTVNTKLIVGHPALAAPLAPVVSGAAAVVSPLMARIRALHPPAAERT